MTDVYSPTTICKIEFVMNSLGKSFSQNYLTLLNIKHNSKVRVRLKEGNIQ